MDHGYRGDRLELPLGVVGRLQQSLSRGLIRPLAIELQQEVERLEVDWARLDWVAYLAAGIRHS
jgi:hypothetical protein